MSFFATQNPGISGLDELTSSEEAAVQLLAGLGTSLQVLRTNTAGNALEWATVDVSKYGTSADNQIAVWTGDGIVEGTTALTFDSSIGNLIVTSSDAGNSGPTLELYHNSASPAANDTVASIKFYGKDSVGNKQLYSSITGTVDDVTNASEDSSLRFSVYTAGSGKVLYLGSNYLAPLTTNTLNLGSGSLRWGGLFLEEGATINWDNGDATLTQSGNTITVGGSDFLVTTPGTAATSVATLQGTQTITNKRITKRTGTITSSAVPTINTDDVDFFSITAQAENITSMSTNLSGTPTEGQTLWIAITGTGARTITWGTSFEASTVALPTTTISTNRLDVNFIWNTVTSKWRCVTSA